MEEPEAAASDSQPSGRWPLIRDVAVFQMKLLLDASRDVVLSPLSLLAGAIDLLRGSEPPGRSFDRLLAAGRRSEVWINLFGGPRVDAPAEIDGPRDRNVDSIVRHVERLIARQHARGGVTSTAKEAIDRSLDAITRRRDP